MTDRTLWRCVAPCSFALLTAVAGVRPAAAASPVAWADHRREVVNACLQVTELRNARPAGELIEFDDTVGQTALLVTGTYPQKHMKGRRGQVLCLFDKRTRYAQVAEADALRTPAKASEKAKKPSR